MLRTLNTSVNIPPISDPISFLAEDVPWPDCYHRLEHEVRVALTQADVPPDRPIYTAQLVAGLYPPDDGTDSQPHTGRAKQRMFRGLMALATRGLADCATRGKVPLRPGSSRTGAYGGSPRFPWLWHRPIPRTNPEEHRPNPPTTVVAGQPIPGTPTGSQTQPTISLDPAILTEINGRLDRLDQRLNVIEMKGIL